MKKKCLLILSSALMFCGILFSQVSQNSVSYIGENPAPTSRTCAVMEHETDLQLQNPSRFADRQTFEQSVQNFISMNQNSMSTQAVITIPIVVHVVWKTAAQNINDLQVLSQIQVLNEDFGRTNADAVNTPAVWQGVSANTTIQFCMAQRTPTGVATNGIERRNTTTTAFTMNDNVKHFSTQGLDAWDPTRYLNIWVCNMSGGILGYGEFPTGTVSQTFGVVIQYNAFGSQNIYPAGTYFPTYNLGRTTTHEFSHCFNLFHIWGDDNGACSGSDLCADTPNQGDATFGSPTWPITTDPCSPGSPGIMFMNYMDYSDDAVMNNFTNNQKTRMLAVLNVAPYNALQTSNGCQAPASAPPVAAFTITPTSACVGSGVSFTDNSTGSPTSWSWTFPSGTPATSTVQNPSGVTWATAGTYTITLVATNSNGSNSITHTLTITALPTISTTTSAGTICAGSSVTITGFGGVTYTWMPGSLTGNPIVVSPATSTTYTVTGTNAAGCSNTATRPIIVNPSPTVTTTTTSGTICAGSSTTITASGAITYSWMPGSLTGATITISPASTTTYTVTGTSGGCTGTTTRTITVNPNPTVTVSATSTTICSGTSTTLTAAGATTYSWMPGTLSGTSVVVTPATTTTYTVTGTTVGCTGTITQLITVNPSPTVTTTAPAGAICSGNSKTITASGAVTYTWMPGSLSGNPVTVFPVTTTTYTVTGTAANGCTGTATRTVTVNPSPTVTASASSTSICAGSPVTLSASGATSYNWQPGNHNGQPWTTTPAATTTYTVTGTTSGCTGTSTLLITVNPIPTVTTTTTGATICSGNSTTITASGATTYAWMPGSLTGTTVTVSPGATTTYTVTGTSAAGCTSTATRTITVNPTPTVTASATSASICAGSSTTLSATGASTYVWNPGAHVGANWTVTPATTTTYTVTGASAAGCTSTATQLITVNPIPTVTTSTTGNTICVGNSTTITASGATTYSWMPGSLSGTTVTVSPVATTTYTVTGTSAGCSSTATQLITVNPTPTVTTTTTGGTICSGNSTTITASGASTYTWMPGSLSGTTVTVSPATTTTYTVTGTSATGCTSNATRTITVNPTPTVIATATSNSICIGSSTTLSASGATSYVWNPGAHVGANWTVTPAVTTTYTVTGTSAGCTSTATQLITVNPIPTITTSTTGNTICAGDSTTITASGAATYTWMPGSLSGAMITDAPMVTTTYTVTGTSAAGCTSTATIIITVNPVPSVSATATPNVICIGNPITLDATGTSTYNWLPQNATGASVNDSPNASTTYTVTGTDVNGCTNTATVAVTVNPLPSVSADATPNAICIGNPVTLDATGASTYNWLPQNATGATVIDNPNASTNYTVTGTDVNGCTNTATVAVTVNDLPVVTVSGDTLICLGANGSLNASGASTYAWMPGTLSGSSVMVSPSSATTYTVTGTDLNGCSNSGTISVNIDTPPASPSISVNGVILTSTVIGSSYQWFLNGNPIAGATSQSYTATQNGSYTVEVYDAAGCGSGQSSAVVDPLGIENQSSVDFINLFPNPNDGHFQLNFNIAKADNYVLGVHNALGQIVYSEMLNNFHGTFSREMDLSLYGKGVYTIRLKNAVNEIVIKTVVY